MSSQLHTIVGHGKPSNMPLGEWLRQNEDILGKYLDTDAYRRLSVEQQADVRDRVALVLGIARFPMVATWSSKDTTVTDEIRRSKNGPSPADFVNAGKGLAESSSLPVFDEGLFGLMTIVVSIANFSMRLRRSFGHIDPREFFPNWGEDKKLSDTRKYIERILKIATMATLKNVNLLEKGGSDRVKHVTHCCLVACTKPQLREAINVLFHIVKEITILHFNMVIRGLHKGGRIEWAKKSVFNTLPFVSKAVQSFIEARKRQGMDQDEATFEYYGQSHPLTELPAVIEHAYMLGMVTSCVHLVAPVAARVRYPEHCMPKELTDKIESNKFLSLLFSDDGYLMKLVRLSRTHPACLPFQSVGASHPAFRTWIVLDATLRAEQKKDELDFLDMISKIVLDVIREGFSKREELLLIELLNDSGLRSVDDEHAAKVPLMERSADAMMEELVREVEMETQKPEGQRPQPPPADMPTTTDLGDELSLAISDTDDDEEDETAMDTEVQSGMDAVVMAWDEGLEIFDDTPDSEMPAQHDFKHALENSVCILNELPKAWDDNRCARAYTAYFNEADEFMRRINLALRRPLDHRVIYDDVLQFKKPNEWSLEEYTKRLRLIKSLAHVVYKCLQLCRGKTTAVTDSGHAHRMSLLAEKGTGRRPPEYAAIGGKVVDFSYALDPGSYIYVPDIGTPYPDASTKKGVHQWEIVRATPSLYTFKEIEMSFSHKHGKDIWVSKASMDNEEDRKAMVEALRKRFKFAMNNVEGHNPVVLLSLNMYSLAVIAYQAYYDDADTSFRGCPGPIQQ